MRTCSKVCSSVWSEPESESESKSVTSASSGAHPIIPIWLNPHALQTASCGFGLYSSLLTVAARYPISVISSLHTEQFSGCDVERSCIFLYSYCAYISGWHCDDKMRFLYESIYTRTGTPTCVFHLESGKSQYQQLIYNQLIRRTGLLTITVPAVILSLLNTAPLSMPWCLTSDSD